ncbi:MAG: DUF465 domain-containing protein [Deltaproteobacteria bacterium]|nr:DUF465 domain-containing protein [Deltaproteobacteria bacterium]
METRDEHLINRLMPDHPELRKLMDDHREFEKKLREFNERPFLTPLEDQEKKVLQKAKLAGKDKIEMIIAPHRTQ